MPKNTQTAIIKMSSFLDIPKRPSSPSIRSPRGSIDKVRPSVGASPFTALMQERYDQLMIDFQEIDHDKDGKITFEEIQSFLSRKQGEDFDRALCMSLFKKLDRDQDMKISPDEFIWSYVDTEDIMMRKIKENKKYINESLKKKDDVEKRLVPARAEEQMTVHGLMRNSFVTVKVLSARDLLGVDSDGLSDPFVVIEVEGREIPTKHQEGDLNPVWDEEFSLNVIEGKGDVVVTVYSKHRNAPPGFLGRVVVPLASLGNQKKIDKHYNLLGPKNEESWHGRIHLQLQWIWSKVKYLEEVALDWQRSIEREQAEIDSLNLQLESLRKPFGLLNYAQQYPEDPAQRVHTPNSPGHHIESEIAVKIDGFTRGQLSVVAGKQGFFLKLISVYIAATVFVMFARPDFPNLTMALTCYFFAVTGLNSPSDYRNLTIGLVITVVSDIYWILKFARDWDDPPMLYVEHGVFIASILNMITKLIILFVCWKRSLG